MKLFDGELPLDSPVDTDRMERAASRNEVFLYQGFDTAVTRAVASKVFDGTLTIAADTASADTMPMSEGWLAIRSRSCGGGSKETTCRISLLISAKLFVWKPLLVVCCNLLKKVLLHQHALCVSLTVMKKLI